MTLCIAAYAGEFDDAGALQTSICFCADARIETHASGAETEYKFRKIAARWAAMIAGVIGRSTELLELYSAHLANEKMDDPVSIEALRLPPQLMKRRLAGEFISSMTGLTLDEFTAQGQTLLPSSLYENLWNDIARIEIGCQLVLIPIDQTRKLYSIDRDGSLTIHNEFCAIGSGASNAEAWLHYRQQRSSFGLAITTVHLLEAKRFAENAPGVGKKVDFAVLDDQKRLIQYSEQAGKKGEDEAWKRYGPRKIPSSATMVLEGFPPTPWDDLGIG
jgi:hypothetical protein